MKKNCLVIYLVCCLVGFGYAQQPKTQGAHKELLMGPVNPSKYEAWLDGMKKWRENKKDSLKYNDAEYLRPENAVAKGIFNFVQMMAHDRYFYDPVTKKYTVDRYLNDLKQRYNGIDGVLIWPTYPNIGVDDRNQYELLADMPGGIEGVKQMVADFKKRGVKVFFPIMIWDHGTRKIELSMAEALIKEMKAIGADGLNGDTMNGVTEDYRKAAKDFNHHLLFQPEWAIQDLKMLEWNVMSWGYFWNYKYIPGVSVYKWLEPRHQTSVTNRWVTNRNNDLQYAFFNGLGYNTWENIWGTWNQISDRDAASIYRISSIYRQFPNAWSSMNWQPHIPTQKKGVFASVFPGESQTLYTLVNRDTLDKRGKQLKLPYKEGVQYFDVWNGKELKPEREADEVYLSFLVEGRGFGAILATASASKDSTLKPFLATMRSLSEKPLKDYSSTWKPLPQQIVAIKKTVAAKTAPEDMVLIPAVKDYVFESVGVMIEGDNLPNAVGIQHAWQEHPSRSQKQTINVDAFYMDKYPVTNKQFKKFIDATKYRPADDHNFLKDWKNGVYPKGWDNKPVTWVSIEDARAYAQWAGKRLPHEWEWQYAAQGTDGRLYPWGNTKDNTKMPLPDTTRKMREPTAVDAFPAGASPFGVIDLIGNVWQWTDEYVDDHTRAAVLKGCGYYHAQTSKWYFPETYELNKYGKYLLMAPSIDRSATIGFRCVVDK